MYAIFAKTFPELNIVYDSEKNLVSGKTPGEEEEGEWFRLLLWDQYMEVICIKNPRQRKCSLSGSIILVRLYEVAHTLNKPYIVLYDSSEIYAGHKEPICFYRYHILMHGISWYNKFGFFSENYLNEYAHNYELINSPVKLYDKFREYQHFYKFFKKEELEKMSVKEAMVALNLLWRSQVNFDNDLYELIQFIVLEPPIKYNHQLRLSVKDPRVEEMYRVLSAQ